jgi:hypothetical protein
VNLGLWQLILAILLLSKEENRGSCFWLVGSGERGGGSRKKETGCGSHL